jgi:carbamoyl-phosphate synthase large subunit
LKNILITSAGKRVVLVQIFQRTLQEMGLDAKVYTTDMRPTMAPAGIVSDGCILVPRCTADNYIDCLLDICRDKQVGVVIPTIDTELLVLAENHKRFMEQGVRLAVPDKEFIQICRDKRLTKDFFMQAGIAVPQPVDKNHPVFPMFAKPYDGSLSTNIHIIRRPEDLTSDILNDPKLIFMEYIDPKEYKEFTVDIYYGLDGCVKGIVPRERIEIRAGEINKGITRKNGIVPFLRQRLGVLKGVRGCICLQLFWRESDGDVKGIEINPRFGGGFPLSYHAKANYVDWLIREYLLHETVDYSEAWLDRTLMLRYDNDIIVYDAEE